MRLSAEEGKITCLDHVPCAYVNNQIETAINPYIFLIK